MMYTGYMSETQTTQGQEKQYNADGLRILKNGSLYDEARRRIVTGPTNPPINKQNAAEIVRIRHDKARRRIAEALVESSKKTGNLPRGGGAADALGAAAGLLYEQIVLSADAPARERRETWALLGKYAGYLGDMREKADAGDGVTLQIDGATAAELLQRLLQARNTPQSTVIDADSVDTE